MKEKLITHLAKALSARNNCLAADKRDREGCKAPNNQDWISRWDLVISNCERRLPTGSGFDAGSTVFGYSEKSGRLVLKTYFHHMDQHGGYDVWTRHLVTVKPSLLFGFTVSVSGSNRNNIKDYISECFETELSTVYDINPDYSLTIHTESL